MDRKFTDTEFYQAIFMTQTLTSWRNKIPSNPDACGRLVLCDITPSNAIYSASRRAVCFSRPSAETPYQMKN